MKYIRKEIEGNAVIIFQNPDAWLATSRENADAIESEIHNRPDHVSTLLSRIEKKSRTPTAEHLALYPVIKLTNRCNLNCSHCYIEAMNSMRKAKYDLDLEETAEFLKYVTELGRKMGNPTKTVQLFGGEPTLSKVFPDVVRIARDMDLLVRVSTNAASTKHFQSAEFEEFYKDRGIEWRVH
ncbi:hypothetical protein CNECB9_5390011 [Cupriavidus necator]|uniref:Radical SAM core domain-containing protein n=1 Tax=Cupriavidus necator TaxID=106590 RepID=A0A1K0IPY9_CUPNE|nr:hypothetical protein CNECB9_5390011 [Cupriavidus necator]